jgi:CheY-like chemotaxis protein
MSFATSLDTVVCRRSLNHGMERRVLVVDDSEDIVDVCEYALRLAGYRVTCARDGAEGLLQVQASQPELIILDMMMPVLDGLAFLAELPRTAVVPPPVIAYSGFDKFEQLVEAAGAAAFLRKPFQLETLMRLVAALLAGGRASLAPQEGRVFGVLPTPARAKLLATDERLRNDLNEVRLCSSLYFGGKPCWAEDLAVIAHAERLGDQLIEAAARGEAWTPLHLAPGIPRQTLLEVIVDAELRRAERDRTHVELLVLPCEPSAPLLDRSRQIAGDERLVLGVHRLGAALVLASTSHEEAASRMDRVAGGLPCIRRDRFDPTVSPFLAPGAFLR